MFNASFVMPKPEKFTTELPGAFPTVMAPVPMPKEPVTVSAGTLNVTGSFGTGAYAKRTCNIECSCAHCGRACVGVRAGERQRAGANFGQAARSADHTAMRAGT